MSITMKLSLMSNTSEAFVRIAGVFLPRKPGGENVNFLEVSTEFLLDNNIWFADAGVEVQVRRSGKSRAEEGVAGWLEECSRGNLAEAGRVRAEGDPEMFIISMLSARFDSNNFANFQL